MHHLEARGGLRQQEGNLHGVVHRGGALVREGDTREDEHVAPSEDQGGVVREKIRLGEPHRGRLAMMCG